MRVGDLINRQLVPEVGMAGGDTEPAGHQPEILSCHTPHGQQHVYGEVDAEEDVEDAHHHQEQHERPVRDAQICKVGYAEVNVDCDNKNREHDGEDLGQTTALELAHNLVIAGESYARDDGEGKHHGHQTVQQIVHPRQVIDLIKEGDEEGGGDGDGPGQ